MVAPVFYEGPMVSEVLQDLICRCRGKKVCSTCCTCHQQKLPCTELCSCSASDDCCNAITSYDGVDEEDEL